MLVAPCRAMQSKRVRGRREKGGCGGESAEGRKRERRTRCASLEGQQPFVSSARAVVGIPYVHCAARPIRRRDFGPP